MARERKPSSKIDRLLDELMEDGVDAEDLFGEDGLLKRMKKRMAERILETELTDHLRTGLADHRRRNRRGPGLAIAAPGPGLSDPVPGCPVRQDT